MGPTPLSSTTAALVPAVHSCAGTPGQEDQLSRTGTVSTALTPVSLQLQHYVLDKICVPCRYV
jgi:hypothetical protein